MRRIPFGFAKIGEHAGTAAERFLNYLRLNKQPAPTNRLARRIGEFGAMPGNATGGRLGNRASWHLVDGANDTVLGSGVGN